MVTSHWKCRISVQNYAQRNGINELFLEWMLILFEVNKFFFLLNTAFAWHILLWTSLQHLFSNVILLPRYDITRIWQLIPIVYFKIPFYCKCFDQNLWKLDKAKPRCRTGIHVVMANLIELYLFIDAPIIRTSILQ